MGVLKDQGHFSKYKYGLVESSCRFTLRITPSSSEALSDRRTQTCSFCLPQFAILFVGFGVVDAGGDSCAVLNPCLSGEPGSFFCGKFCSDTKFG